MKQVYLWVAMLCLMLATGQVQAGQRFKLSERYKTQRYDLGQIGKLISPTSIDVVYFQKAGKAYAEVYAPDNLLPHIVLKESQGALQVTYDQNLSFYGENKTEVRIYAPSITDFKLLGSGDLAIPKGLNTDKELRLTLNSSGDLECGDLHCGTLVAELNSSGDLKCGKVKCSRMNAKLNSSGDWEMQEVCAESVQVQLNSSGDFSAKAVKCGETSIRVLSAGDCGVNRLTCSGTVTVESGSSGDVELSGVCSRAVLSVNSSGDIMAGGLKADAVEAFSGSVGNVVCYPLNSLKATTTSVGSVEYLYRPEVLELSGKNIKGRK